MNRVSVLRSGRRMQPFARFGLASVLLFAALAARVSADETTDAARKPTRVAVLIFEGVELLDFAGPAEVFIVAGQKYPFQVFTVAAEQTPLRTMGGIRVTPDYTYDKAPRADILVVPGGNMSKVGADGIKWIRQSADKSRIVMSVCFGAMLLARADLLDGVTATTHSWALKSLESAAPKCKVVRGRRYVDSGKIVTTAGVTAGIDGALHVVERIAGKKVADWTSETWMEYKRNRPDRD